MKNKIILLFIFTLLVGCQGKKEMTTVCKGNDEKSVTVNTIKHIEDRITSVSYQNTLQVDDSLIDYITGYLSQYKTTVAHIEGLSYEYSIEGNTVVETTTIDYETADMEQLADEGFIAVSESGNKAYVGYAITVNQMKASGYECTEE